MWESTMKNDFSVWKTAGSNEKATKSRGKHRAITNKRTSTVSRTRSFPKTNVCYSAAMPQTPFWPHRIIHSPATKTRNTLLAIPLSITSSRPSHVATHRLKIQPHSHNEVEDKLVQTPCEHLDIAAPWPANVQRTWNDLQISLQWRRKPAVKTLGCARSEQDYRIAWFWECWTGGWEFLVECRWRWGP